MLDTLGLVRQGPTERDWRACHCDGLNVRQIASRIDYQSEGPWVRVESEEASSGSHDPLDPDDASVCVDEICNDIRGGPVEVGHECRNDQRTRHEHRCHIV